MWSSQTKQLWWKKDIKGRYCPTHDYIKFMNNILDAKIKAKELVNKSNISGFITTSDLNNKIAILARKAELKPEQYVCLSTMI